MDQTRQEAFQKLRPVCVELSSVALKFTGNQTSVKDVLQALQKQSLVLESLGSQGQLDEKLAEYAFFPLTHIFNESKRLSPRCLQVAVESVTILVSQGWRQKLASAMGKQLLILMSLIAGPDPRTQSQPPSDDLKSAAFKCIESLLRWLSSSSAGQSILEDQSTRNIVDQLAYLLVENVNEAVSDQAQISAAEALHELNTSIQSRVFLASLLPRTVSSLTKALKPSTQARRTSKVFVINLNLLAVVLIAVLADDVVSSEDKEPAEKDALNESWLKATTTQVKNALTQICKLRTQTALPVRDALFDLCFLLVEKCSATLHESVAVLTDTMVVLNDGTVTDEKTTQLKMLLFERPEMVEMLQSSFYDWCQTLPRVMQGSDDRPKQLTLAKIMHSYNLLNHITPSADQIANTLSSAILRSIVGTVETEITKPIQAYGGEQNQYTSLIRQNEHQRLDFDLVLFSHQSQKESFSKIEALINDLREGSSAGAVTRNMLDTIPDLSPDQKLAPVWLAVQLLRKHEKSAFELDDMLDWSENANDEIMSRPFLIQDLYTQMKDIILDSSPYGAGTQYDSRLIALALECVILQADQMGQAYRGELYETLYPVLALLSSRETLLRDHAITALDLLASACRYESVATLLIENVDYMVNSIAWKLNTFNLSPEAPAALNMMIRLVGARVVPYLDDLITSIFAALDSFHGYPQWVEILFETLKTIVDESVKTPQLTITNEGSSPRPVKSEYSKTTTNDIVQDLQAWRRRKRSTLSSKNTLNHEAAPHRPWNKRQDDPNFVPDPTEGKDLETLLREAETADEENDLPAPKEPAEEDPTKPLSKSHELLLKIAQATVPHLSSPSPRVRQILLQLLGQISPLLAMHENTFLPLVNAVWPGVVQRLFATVAASASLGDEPVAEGETAYNVALAADVVAGLCANAGAFMATRIEQIFAQLKSMYMKMWKGVEAQMKRANRHDTSKSNLQIEDVSGSAIKGVVDLQVIKNDSSSLGTTGKDDIHAPSTSLSTVSRTSTGQIFSSLVNLLVTILKHVRLSGDNADELFNMLIPLIDYPGKTGPTVSVALETYNADAVWVARCRKIGEDEIAEGLRAFNDRIWKVPKMPALRAASREVGFQLQPIVF